MSVENYSWNTQNCHIGSGRFIYRVYDPFAASLFLVAFELKQGRDIAEAELLTQRYEMANKVNGIYDLDYRWRKEPGTKDEFPGIKQGIEALSPEAYLTCGLDYQLRVFQPLEN